MKLSKAIQPTIVKVVFLLILWLPYQCSLADPISFIITISDYEWSTKAPEFILNGENPEAVSFMENLLKAFPKDGHFKTLPEKPTIQPYPFAYEYSQYLFHTSDGYGYELALAHQYGNQLTESQSQASVIMAIIDWIRSTFWDKSNNHQLNKVAPHQKETAIMLVNNPKVARKESPDSATDRYNDHPEEKKQIRKQQKTASTSSDDGDGHNPFQLKHNQNHNCPACDGQYCKEAKKKKRKKTTRVRQTRSEIDRRLQANEREKMRMHELRDGFSSLKDQLINFGLLTPQTASKINTLNIASDFFFHLNHFLRLHEQQPAEAAQTILCTPTPSQEHSITCTINESDHSEETVADDQEKNEWSTSDIEVENGSE